MKRIATTILGLAFGAFLMFGIVEVSRTAHADAPVLAQADAGVVVVEPFEGSGSAVAPVPATAPTTLPDPSTAPTDSASLVWKLYKAGHLIPAIIVFSFFLLLLLQKWIAWLRTGYRKLVVASALAGLGMLAERAAAGTPPNMMMIMGAFGAAIALYVKGGEPAEK